MRIGPDAELASWIRRGAALVLDLALLSVVIASTLLVSGAPVEEIRERLENRETLLVLALFFVPEAIYQTAMIGSRNQTLGKMALGIAVVDADSRARIGYARAFTRWLSMAAMRAFTIPTIVDHFWPLHDRRNQSLHDKLARSVVVRT